MKTLNDLEAQDFSEAKVDKIINLIKANKFEEARLQARYIHIETIWNILTYELYEQYKQNELLKNQLAELVILVDPGASTESINKHQDDK